MHRLRTTLTAAAALTALLATTAAGCGSNAKPNGNTTHVSIQNPGGTSVCKFVLVMAKPKNKQITVAATVTCNFQALATHTTAVVQARETGTSTWQDVDDERQNLDAPPVTVTTSAICLPGYDMRAYATISGIHADGATFKSEEATSGHSYTESECDQ